MLEKQILLVLNALKVIPMGEKLSLDLLDNLVYKKIMTDRVEPFTEEMAKDRYYAVRAMYSHLFINYSKGLVSKAALARLIKTLVESVMFKGNGSKKSRDAYFNRNSSLPPSLAVISPTQKCNLNCTGCYASSDSKKCNSIDHFTIEKIVNQLYNRMGMRFFVISGGEPLLYNSEGYTIFDLAKNFKDCFFLVYTNGTLINKSVAKKIAECGNITPAISVEGYREETDARRGVGAFAKILEAFTNLREAGVPFGVSVTATKKNLNLLTSNLFYNYYFKEIGATYMWSFQLMPIGRATATELMITPSQRVELLKKQREILIDEKYFVADFWNSAVMSRGCIACGSPSGYFHIDWDGNILPCVFVPYYQDNIYNLFKNGKTIEDAMNSKLFRAGRELQYKIKHDCGRIGNLLMPCIYRDHHKEFISVIDSLDKICCENAEAEEALTSLEYHKRLEDFDGELEKLTADIWEDVYLKNESINSKCCKN